ncbi:MAG: DUF3833 family protein, partial [Candidatus Thiodiazotropha sp.]
MPYKHMLLLSALTLSGCSGIEVTRYQAERPELRLEEYFNGTLDGWGQFQKRDGSVLKRFKVKVDARWEGDQGILDEHFEYSDGTRQQRVKRVFDLMKDFGTSKSTKIDSIFDSLLVP